MKGLLAQRDARKCRKINLIGSIPMVDTFD